MAFKRYNFVRQKLDAIVREAVKSAKNGGIEICGLILDNGLFLELVRVRNKVKRGGGFSFYFNEVRAIERMSNVCGHSIVGTFHSHPVGIAKPGSSDVINAVDDSLMLIIDVSDRKAQLWHIKDRRVRQLQLALIEAVKGVNSSHGAKSCS